VLDIQKIRIDNDPKAAVQMIEGASVVGLDLETTGLNPRRSEVRLVQVSDGEEAHVLDCRLVDVNPILKTLLRDTVTVVTHGGDFEWRFIYHHFGIELTDVSDTMLMARLLTLGDMSVECGLGPVVERYLGVELDKNIQTSDWSAKVLTERQLDYAAEDARILVPLYANLAEHTAFEELEKVAEIENRCLPPVARMKLEGLPVDRAAWDENALENAHRLRALEREMLEANWMPARPPIPQEWALQGPDCKEMLEKTLGIEIPGTTAKDLKPLAEEHKIVGELLAYRKAKGEKRERLRQIVQELAATKPSVPAPPWNFASPLQVNEIVYEIMGFELDSTDEANLLRFVKDHPFFKKLLEYRSLKKLVGTYGSGWFKKAYDSEAGRVYPTYRQIGTSTGRFASGERGASPNIQNVPADYRRFFIAPRGRTFVDVDYSQIEVRIAAKLLGVEVLLGLYEENPNADVYKATAAHMLDIDPEDVTKRQRNLAKAIMLGMIYGLSARGLPTYAFKNYGIEMTPAEAEEHVEAFYALYPEIEEYHGDILEELDCIGAVDQRTMTGRLRAGITNRNEAINAPVQGTAADGLKAAMALVHERLPNGAFIAASLHDELLIECDEANGTEALEIVSETMVEAMNGIVNTEGPHVPITVEGAVTKTWTKE
jgi:DNA polymerase I-like protein with 3'-5' exonuclease and polymerase domains